jgi:hypothetical protein
MRARARRFKKEFFKTDTPVIIRGATDSWPAMRRWPDLRCFARACGHRTVPVEVGRLRGGRKQVGAIAMIASSRCRCHCQPPAAIAIANRQRELPLKSGLCSLSHRLSLLRAMAPLL